MGCASSKTTLISTTSGGSSVLKKEEGERAEQNVNGIHSSDSNSTPTNVEDDDEGETVALETTSVTAQLTQKWVRS